MGIAINVLAGVMIALCVIMVLVILLQEDKNGGGIGMIGGSSQSFFGASSASMLTKITTILMAIFFVLSIVIGSISAKSTREALIGDNLVSELEFESNESDVAQVKKGVVSAPAEILAEDFDNLIIAKITDESVKNEMLSYYEKDKGGSVYKLSKKALAKKSRIVEILNSIEYSTEAAATVVNE